MDTPFSWPILPWQTPLPSPVKREVVVRPDKSVYRADRDLQGGYYVQSVTNDDVRELIISFSDESFEPAPNNPDATTIPGFYPSPGVRFDFEKIEVVKKKVYFKTRKIKGVSFLFRGTATKIKNQDFYGIPIFYITGFLERKENERITRKEKVTFQHMVNM